MLLPRAFYIADFYTVYFLYADLGL